MNKEEIQKNKKDGEINFFEGTERQEEAVGFFGQVKNLFQNKSGTIATRGGSISTDDINKNVIPSNPAPTGFSQKEETSITGLKVTKAVKPIKENKAENKKIANRKSSQSIPDWSAINILSTDLIKGESTINYNWDKKVLILSVNVILVIVLIAAVYGGLVYWEKSGKITNEELNKKTEILNSQVEGLKKEVAEIDVFNKKIAIAKNLLGDHIYWDDFFLYLEKNILTDIYLSSDFSGSVDGQYTFRAYTKDLKTMLDQVNYLRQDDKKDKILSVSIANVSAGDEVDTVGEIKTISEKYKVSFDLILNINKDIFYKK